MGSGHFLVTAVDFLSDYIAELIEYVPAVPEWLHGNYVSPLVERVATVRGEILRRFRRIELGSRRGPTHRSGHHSPHGAQAMHLRNRQECPDRRIGQGVAVAGTASPSAPHCHFWTTTCAAEIR